MSVKATASRAVSQPAAQLDTSQRRSASADEPRALSMPARALLVTGILLAAVLGTSRMLPVALQIFHPAPLLLAAVVFATLLGGLRAGMASTFLALAYELHFYFAYGEDIHFTLGTVAVLAVAAPVTAIAIGSLKRQVERVELERKRLLLKQAEILAREMALRETNQHMDEFLGIASHELKTPLTSLKGTLQLARRKLSPAASTPAPGQPLPAGISDLLARAERQADRMNRLVEDLLDVSRIQTGKLTMRPAPCDLVDIVREAVEEQCQSWPTRTITLELAVDGAMPLVADGDRVGQVVTNYLTNALKFSAAERPIGVRLSVEGAEARVAVCDEGPGLSKEACARVWERFHQVSGMRPHGGSLAGLGLGLHISRAIIEQHAGQVGVESTPGVGSTFWFTLPLAYPEPADASAEPVTTE